MKYLNQFDMIKPYELAKRPRGLRGVKPLVISNGYKFYVLGDTLYLFRPLVKHIVCAGGYRKYKLLKAPSDYVVFKSFTKYTALEVINSFVGSYDSAYYDGALKVYRELGLPIWYANNILKEL